MTYHSDSSDAPRFVLYCLGGGPALLTWGLFRLREKRILENTPLSKVRSAAMGVVELCGAAKPRKEITDPITGQKCCWWSCEVQEYVSSGRNSGWRTIRSLASHEPFYFEDDTGMVMVDPTGAELYIGENIIPLSEANRAQFAPSLSSWGVDAATWFGAAKRMRAKLQALYPGDSLTVMGELSHRVDYLEQRKARFQERLASVKKDPALMAQADANHDGRIDPEEWDAFRAKLEETFLAEEAARESQVPDCDKLVVKDPVNEPFVLSSAGRDQLIGSLTWKAFGGVAGGIAATGLGIGLAQREGFSFETTALLAAAGVVFGCMLGIIGRKGGASWSWLSFSFFSWSR